MAETTTSVLRSQPGVKRDGTKYDGDFYTDGQWMRFQRGLPRKIAGYRSISKFFTEISRGFTSYTQMLLQYCHTGSATLLERVTLDSTLNSSVVSDRTPVAIAATGSVVLATGGAGSVDTVTVNGVTITSGAVAFNVSLAQTATDLASNITAHTSSPNYTAAAVGTTVTITAVTAGAATNGFVVNTTVTTITTTETDMTGGSNALAESTDNKWMFDYEYDSSTTDNSLIAHVAPNGSCICNDEGGQIFTGSIIATTPLVEVQIPAGRNATGGIVAIHPYLFYYGSAGIIGWSVAGDLTDLSGSGSGVARVWGQKIIKGYPLRAGAGAAPAGIFWAYDAVIRSSFTGGSTVFQFDVLATGTSIMSPDSVVDYDGVFYWAGVDRFMMFNGVVRDLPNDMNHNWFFEGINPAYTTKVFAFKVPYFGEIWWCYPRGDATECSHAVIFNVKQNIWYDTELPASMRTAAHYNNGYAAPLLMDATESANGFKLWIHEQGTDKIDGTSVQPIESYFETADLSSLVQGADSGLRITRIEPDFVQVGPMTVQVTGRANAKAAEVASRIFTFPETASTPQEQIVMLKEQRRELRVKFSSNALNGDYQMGQIIAHSGPGDGTMLGGV